MIAFVGSGKVSFGGGGGGGCRRCPFLIARVIVRERRDERYVIEPVAEFLSLDWIMYVSTIETTTRRRGGRRRRRRPMIVFLSCHPIFHRLINIEAAHENRTSSFARLVDNQYKPNTREM